MKMRTTIPNATKIMIVRHAEKPSDSPPPQGVTNQGEEDEASLSVQGWIRAGALVSFFAPTNGQFQSDYIATPQFIYASGVKQGSKSKRPLQTVIPLSEKLELKINHHYFEGQEAALVADALKCNGVVLICWKHKTIPTLAHQILNSTTTAPSHWAEHRFDLVWVFDWDSTSGTYHFNQVPQCLLAGDSSILIK